MEAQQGEKDGNARVKEEMDEKDGSMVAGQIDGTNY